MPSIDPDKLNKCCETSNLCGFTLNSTVFVNSSIGLTEEKFSLITEEDILSEGQTSLKNKLLNKLNKFEKEEKIRIGMLNSEKSSIF